MSTILSLCPIPVPISNRNLYGMLYHLHICIPLSITTASYGSYGCALSLPWYHGMSDFKSNVNDTRTRLTQNGMPFADLHSPINNHKPTVSLLSLVVAIVFLSATAKLSQRIHCTVWCGVTKFPNGMPSRIPPPTTLYIPTGPFSSCRLDGLSPASFVLE